jgi:hypothetical protein
MMLFVLLVIVLVAVAVALLVGGALPIGPDRTSRRTVIVERPVRRRRVRRVVEEPVDEVVEERY